MHNGWTVNPWLWALLGVVLLALEMATPGGFYFVFFGCGALLAALLAPFLSEVWQWVAFVISSLVSLAVFRTMLLRRFSQQPAGREAVDTLIGQTAVTVEAIPACGHGRVELHGTTWQAQNITDSPLPARQRCRIVRVEGITLYLMEE